MKSVDTQNNFQEYIWAEAKKRKAFIPDGPINKAIAEWHAKQELRPFKVASPSRLTMCPRVVWRRSHGVTIANPMGWGTAQRMLLGRAFEKVIVPQLGDALLHWWPDEEAGESEPFVVGEGDTKIVGTPDLLLKVNGKVYISDAKTSRADSFAYIPIEDEQIWDDEGWYKYKMQVEMYYHLCHANKAWFDENKLPLPEGCHLFSYALDDGVVKRDIYWTPSIPKEELLKYAIRFNQAVKSETEPACRCTEHDVKFCNYATEFTTTKSGYKLGVRCCG